MCILNIIDTISVVLIHVKLTCYLRDEEKQEKKRVIC